MEEQAKRRMGEYIRVTPGMMTRIDQVIQAFPKMAISEIHKRLKLPPGSISLFRKGSKKYLTQGVFQDFFMALNDMELAIKIKSETPVAPDRPKTNAFYHGPLNPVIKPARRSRGPDKKPRKSPIPWRGDQHLTGMKWVRVPIESVPATAEPTPVSKSFASRLYDWLMG